MLRELELKYPYPRRRPIRTALHNLARLIFAAATDLEVHGQENLPKSGPLIVVANHFSFADPALMVGIAPWPMEFLAGLHMPGAPSTVHWIPRLWGTFRVRRGSVGSRTALRAAETVLKQDGIVGIYPEAGSWAQVLRPARPGTAFLAARTGAPILPMGFDGVPRILPRLSSLRRAKVTVRIGKPFGPFHTTGRGRERRRQLERIGDEIMQHIAALIPPEKRGYYAEDPEVREAAKGTEVYPWHDLDG